MAYVSSPYRSASEWGVYLNIHRAKLVAMDLWKAGFAVICPQANTAFFGGECEDGTWLKGDLEIIRRCDCVVCGPGWQYSAGALGEIELARSIGHPVFEDVQSAIRWLNEQLSDG